MNFSGLLSAVPDSWRKGIVNALGGSFGSSSDNPSRTSTVWFPLDSTREIMPHERRELVKKHRFLRNNFPFVRGMVRTSSRLAIGWGLQPVPKSGNKDYDRRSLAYWKRRTRRQSFDTSGQDNERRMQRLIVDESMVDGEIFGIKVFDDFGRPQRQIIKTEQVGDPDNKAAGENWQDGLLLNGQRRPLKFGVLQNRLPGSLSSEPRIRPVLAKDMLHVYDRERATQTRGLPWGYTGLNHGIDALDITAYAKISKKMDAAIIGALNTPDGTPPKGLEAIMAAAKQATTAAAAATETSAEKTKGGTRFIDLHGSMIPIFKTGESMNFMQRNGTVDTIAFLGWLAAQYAQGFGCPVELIVGLMSGGANVRGNTELAGRFFEDIQMFLIDDWCQPNWENVIGTGLLASQYPRDFPLIEPLDPPPGWDGWDVLEWRGPKNISMDKGRDGKTFLDLKRAGWMSDEEFWTESGEDPEEMPLKIDEELAARRDRWVNVLKLPEDKFWVREFGTNIGGQSAGGDPNAKPEEAAAA